MLSPTPAPGLSDDQKKEQELKNLNDIKASLESATHDIRAMMHASVEMKNAKYVPQNTFAESVTGRKLVELQKKLMEEVRDRADHVEVPDAKRSAPISGVEPTAMMNVRKVYEKLNSELKTHFDNWVAGAEFDFKEREGKIDLAIKVLETKLGELANYVRDRQLKVIQDEITDEYKVNLAAEQKKIDVENAKLEAKLAKLEDKKNEHEKNIKDVRSRIAAIAKPHRMDDDVDNKALLEAKELLRPLDALEEEEQRKLNRIEQEIKDTQAEIDKGDGHLDSLKKKLDKDLESAEKKYEQRAQEIEALADTKRKELEDLKSAEHLKSEFNYLKTTLDAQAQQCISDVRRRQINNMNPYKLKDDWSKLDEPVQPNPLARNGFVSVLKPGTEGVFQRPGKPRVHLDKEGNCYTIPQDHDETMEFLSQKVGARGVKITFPSADLVNPVKVKELYDKAHEHNMHVNLKPLLDMMDAALKNDPSNWEYQKLRNQIQDLIIDDKQWRKTRSGEAEQKYADFATQARLDHRIRELEAANKNNLDNKFPDLKGDEDAQNEKYVKTLLAGTTTELEKLKRLEHEAAVLSNRAQLLDDAQKEAANQLDTLRDELGDPANHDPRNEKYKKCEDAFVKLEDESKLQWEEIKRQGGLIEEQLGELKFDKKTEKGYAARAGAVKKVLADELVPKLRNVNADMTAATAEIKNYKDLREEKDREYRVAHR